MNAIKQENEVKDAVVIIGQIHLLTNCMLMWLKDNCPWAEREQKQLITFEWLSPACLVFLFDKMISRLSSLSKLSPADINQIFSALIEMFENNIFFQPEIFTQFKSFHIKNLLYVKSISWNRGGNEWLMLMDYKGKRGWDAACVRGERVKENYEAYHISVCFRDPKYRNAQKLFSVHTEIHVCVIRTLKQPYEAVKTSHHSKIYRIKVNCVNTTTTTDTARARAHTHRQVYKNAWWQQFLITQDSHNSI